MLRCLIVLATASVALAAVPEPVDANMLFEGPAAGKAVYKAFSLSEWQRPDCTVLMVTRDAAYIRVKDSVRVIDTAHYEIQRIEAVRDGKTLLWSTDDKKQITGSAVPLRQPIAPKSAGEIDLSTYLFHLTGRLHDSIDALVAKNDERAIKQLRSRLDDLKEHAAKNNADPEVRKLLDSLPTYLEARLELRQKKSQFLETHLEKVEESRLKEEEARYKAEIDKMKGLAQYYRGAFPRVVVGLRGRGGYAVYDYGGAMAGVAGMMRSNLQFEHDRLRIIHARKLLDKEKQKQIEDYEVQFDKLREDQHRLYATVGGTYGLPPVKEWLAKQEQNDMLARKGDYAELSRALGTGLEQSGKAVNPFAILDGMQAAARVDNPKRDEQARKVAGSAAGAISLMARIPDDKIFDADRADVLRSAASLSLQAALLESVDGSVASAYSPLAAFAVRCLDQATALQGIDADGTLREQKVLANAAAGRIAEAYRLANEIKPLRKGVVDFMITYARIACVHEQTKEAFNALEDAVNAGYNDIGFITKNPDFLGLKRDAARATAYLKPQITIIWVQPTTAKVVPKAINTNRFEIKNDSPFTLTEIRVSATFEVKGNAGKPIQKALTIKELGKDQKYDWDDVFNGAPGSLSRLKIVIECDQGKYSTEKVEVRK